MSGVSPPSNHCMLDHMGLMLVKIHYLTVDLFGMSNMHIKYTTVMFPDLWCMYNTDAITCTHLALAYTAQHKIESNCDFSQMICCGTYFFVSVYLFMLQCSLHACRVHHVVYLMWMTQLWNYVTKAFNKLEFLLNPWLSSWVEQSAERLFPLLTCSIFGITGLSCWFLGCYGGIAFYFDMGGRSTPPCSSVCGRKN